MQTFRDDASDGTSVSIETQMTIHKQYCEENQIQIIDFYCDDGYTGTNFERPAFKRMMNDVKNHRVNAVIVKDLSRFGRESIYVNYYMQVYFPGKQHSVYHNRREQGGYFRQQI